MTDIPTQVKTSITNIDADIPLYLQFEPKTFPSSASAVYNSDPALGGSHENLMFSHTMNESFVLDMRWNRINLTAGTGVSTAEASEFIYYSRAFIRSLLNPVTLVIGVVGGSAPLVNIVVPGVYDIYARMLNIESDVLTRDPADGSIMELNMKCVFKEDPRYRYSAQDIFNSGYQRS